eukprot:3714980-Rhodomonas_salina.1
MVAVLLVSIRFYYFNSYRDFHPHLIAATAIYLASKVEESPVQPKNIVTAIREIAKSPYGVLPLSPSTSLLCFLPPSSSPFSSPSPPPLHLPRCSACLARSLTCSRACSLAGQRHRGRRVLPYGGAPLQPRSSPYLPLFLPSLSSFSVSLSSPFLSSSSLFFLPSFLPV